MTIRAVLFDLDDTLWPLAPLMEHAEIRLHDWLAGHAPRVTAQYSMDDLRQKRRTLMLTDARYSYDLWALRHAMLTDVLHECGEAAALADEAMQVFAKARNEVALYDDVLPVLQAVGERHVLGSLSNGFADLDAIGIAHFFKASLNAMSVGCAKPDARTFFAACEALNVAPSATIYVGDDLICDVQGAQRAGLRAVWLNRNGRDNPHSAIVPDAECRDLNEVHDFLLGIST